MAISFKRSPCKAQLRFEELEAAHADEEERRFALAELNDLLSGLTRTEARLALDELLSG